MTPLRHAAENAVSDVVETGGGDLAGFNCFLELESEEVFAWGLVAGLLVVESG